MIINKGFVIKCYTFMKLTPFLTIILPKKKSARNIFHKNIIYVAAAAGMTCISIAEKGGVVKAGLKWIDTIVLPLHIGYSQRLQH